MEMPIVCIKKCEERPEERPEDRAEKKVDIVTPLGPLPARRWEMESRVKMPSVNIADTPQH